MEYLEQVRHIFEAVKEGNNPFEGEAAVMEQYVVGRWEEAHFDNLTGQVCIT